MPYTRIRGCKDRAFRLYLYLRCFAPQKKDTAAIPCAALSKRGLRSKPRKIPKGPIELAKYRPLCLVIYKYYFILYDIKAAG